VAYTLFIVKPDGVAARRIGPILARVEAAGFTIRELCLTRLTVDEARRFYQVHRERPFYDELTHFMSSGPCVPCLLEGPGDAIDRLRSLMGVTDSRKAAAGTIRAEFGTDIQANAVHGSDKPETAREEIAFWAAKLGWPVPAEVASR
jgi:nucleoside-diphosphate kinase